MITGDALVFAKISIAQIIVIISRGSVYWLVEKEMKQCLTHWMSRKWQIRYTNPMWTESNASSIYQLDKIKVFSLLVLKCYTLV